MSVTRPLIGDRFGVKWQGRLDLGCGSRVRITPLCDESGALYTRLQAMFPDLVESDACNELLFPIKELPSAVRSTVCGVARALDVTASKALIVAHVGEYVLTFRAGLVPTIVVGEHAPLEFFTPGTYGTRFDPFDHPLMAQQKRVAYTLFAQNRDSHITISSVREPLFFICLCA